MTAKKYLKYFFILFLTTCLVLMGIVYIADPLFQYHGPWLTGTPYLYAQVYQNPGLARNTSYDSALLGTSMTENFQTDWFDEELGWHTVKLSYSGARTSDIGAILEQIFQSNNDVKHLVMNIDWYQLEEDSSSCFVERPAHLYSDTVLDDFPYLLNKDIIKLSCQQLYRAFTGQDTGNMSNAYAWSAEDGVDISRDAVLRDCLVVNSAIVTPVQPKDRESYMGNARANLTNITDYVREHPETDFTFFIPPYSIMYWESRMLDGTFELTLDVSQWVLGELLPYENVQVFYFQNCEDIITDLSLYRDSIHYNAAINRYIFDSIKTGNHRVSLSTYKEEVEKTKNLALNFDYESVWNAYYNDIAQE